MFLEFFIVASTAANLQPICSAEQFHAAIGASLQGKHEIVATAIFDDYQEKCGSLQAEPALDRVSPITKLNNKFERAEQADRLFDALLASLTALDTDDVWKRNIIDLRRTVLLQARDSDNPWPATVWIDLPRHIASPDKSVVNAIDSFLVDNIDSDRKDRFDAFKSAADGDVELCAEITQRAMKRWEEYQKIIDPHTSPLLETHIYPQLDLSGQVRDVVHWIASNIGDDAVVSKVDYQFFLWKNIHEKRRKEIISIVREARSTLGFDPWSRGCGHPNSSVATVLKNRLLQRSAEIVELNRNTCKVMLQELTPAQKKLFYEHQ